MSFGTVLVTGASGFVGAAVVRNLVAREMPVVALTGPDVSREGKAPFGGTVRTVSADVRDTGKMATLLADVKPEVVIHSAWIATPGVYRHSPENTEHLEAGKRFARAFAAAGGKRLVGVGTCFEYDADQGVITETTPLRPGTIYAECKAALAHELARVHAERILSTAWCPLFYLYGPGEDPRRLVPAVSLSLLRGEKAKATTGAQIRDFLHVDDVASALVTIALSGATGRVNICSRRGVTIREIVSTLAALSGHPDAVEWGAIVPKDPEPPSIVGDPGKLRSLGWSPRFNLEEGLRDAFEWWKGRPRSTPG